MAKIISSLPGSTGVLSRTSQLINDGETGISTYVELNDLSTVATTGDYSNLINVPINFTPKVHTHNISDISGTKSEFNTSLIDGNFLFVGDVSNTPDTTTTSKGVIKLAGDLAGTADAPTVPGLATKVDKVTGKSLLSDTEITRLATLSNYTHPTNHPPSIITQDASNRFVTDAEKTAWNAKQSNLGYTPENVANKATTLTASSTLYPNNDAVIAGLATKEDKANKVTSIGSSANDTNYPSELAVKTYADNLVVGMLNDRGTWDASGNVFPTTGGSGVGGAIRKGDMWYISVAGTLGAKLVNVGDSFRALVNAPAQVAANWSILEANIGYVPANDSDVVHLTGAETITGLKTFSPTISASGAIARGTYFTPKLSATANNDVLVGLDINTTFTNGAFTGTTSLPVRVTSNQYIGMNVSRNSTGGSAITISNNNGGYNFGVGSINEFFIQRAGGNIVNTIFPTGNSVIQNGGAFTDDNINRLQVAGTVSSGTTALGNTPPTANNQLTRKDYVDTGLATKEPSFTKNTAFNKNFGTTAGTVVEGNDSRLNNGQTAFGWGNHASAGYTLTTGSNINQSSFRTALGLGSNAYTSTAFLPLSGGDVSGLLKVIGDGHQLSLTGSDQGAIDLYKSGTLGHRLFSDINNFGIYDLENDVTVLSIAKATRAATFASSVTAAPATLPNHVVVKSQLDDFVPSGTVNLTGDQTISGQKNFSSTGKIGMYTDNAFPAISVTTSGSIGRTAAEFINSSSFPNSSALRVQTHLSGGVGNMGLVVDNYSPIGTGIVSNSSEGGVSISSKSHNGDSYISNITSGGTGRNYVGRNNGIETYSVDKIGKVTAASYTATSLPVFENNAAASSLAVGQFYRTSIGVLMVKF